MSVKNSIKELKQRSQYNSPISGYAKHLDSVAGLHMYTKRIIEFEIIWYFSWRPVLYILGLSCAVFALHHYLHLHTLLLPFLPIATVGTAVAFYVGFKNNSSYDRLWESRKIWGEVTNISRAMSSYLIATMRTRPECKEAFRNFIYRHLAFINMLRLQLRRKNVWDDSNEYTRMSRECFSNRPYEEESLEVMKNFCAEDIGLLAKPNVASALIRKQFEELVRFKDLGWIDAFEHSDLLRFCSDFCNHQGKAERIKSFPFPRQYAFFSTVFVYIFVTLLPFGLIGEFAKISEHHEWLVIPFTLLISWVFITMEKVGDTSENPFEGSMNDVPMSTICRNIEIDIRAMLDESALPEPLQAVDHILM